MRIIAIETYLDFNYKLIGMLLNMIWVFIKVISTSKCSNALQTGRFGMLCQTRCWHRIIIRQFSLTSTDNMCMLCTWKFAKWILTRRRHAWASVSHGRLANMHVQWAGRPLVVGGDPIIRVYQTVIIKYLRSLTHVHGCTKCPKLFTYILHSKNKQILYTSLLINYD